MEKLIQKSISKLRKKGLLVVNDERSHKKMENTLIRLSKCIFKFKHWEGKSFLEKETDTILYSEAKLCS